MTTERAYNAKREALYSPCKQAVFFPTGKPVQEAALCAELSRLVYCKFENSVETRNEVEKTLAKVGFEKSDFFSAKGTQAFLARSEVLTVLAFRGTESDDPTDLLTDVQTWSEVWDRGGKVHKGFADALQIVWAKVEGSVKTSKGRLLYTGHSLGAALATLAASLHPPKALYTFGSPRVGDADFTHTLTGIDVHRFANCCDIVTQVPPETLSFRHIGTLHYIDRNGQIMINPEDSMVENDQRKARFEYVVKHTFEIGNVAVRDLADHAPVNYVSALAGNRA